MTNLMLIKNEIIISQDANDSIRIKSKMLEDQTESIRQLKQVCTITVHACSQFTILQQGLSKVLLYLALMQNLGERDNEREKIKEDERHKLRDIEERLEQQLAVSQDLEVYSKIL